ncbi:hypothetical protein ACX6XY_22270 [Streptomyces sp. O3]
MRNDLETREIADAELDAVAGGVVSVNGGLAGALTNDVNHVVDTVGCLETVQSVQGVAAAAPGLVQGISGVHVNAGL